MKELFSTAAPLITVLVLFLAIVVILRLGPKRVYGIPVRAKPLATPNELEFLRRLRQALPQYEVFAQVSMGALLDVELPKDHPRIWTVRRMFAMKIVDFVVCDPLTANVIAAVELDDKTHEKKRDKDARRDALLGSAGIPTVRWESNARPTVEQIAARFGNLRIPRRV